MKVQFITTFQLHASHIEMKERLKEENVWEMLILGYILKVLVCTCSVKHGLLVF